MSSGGVSGLNEVEALRRKLQLSQEKLARLLDVSHRTVWRLENNGNSGVRNTVSKHIERLADLANRFVPHSVSADRFVDWLSTPDPELMYCTPRHLIFFSTRMDQVAKLAKRRFKNG